MQYLRARWYDSDIGRFTSEDTYKGDPRHPLSLNLYTYVANNPLKYIDPNGQDPQYLFIDDFFQGIYDEANHRYNAMKEDPSLYTIGNWITIGAFDTVKGTFMPEDPLSLEHWVDSLGTVFLVYGAGGGVKQVISGIRGAFSTTAQTTVQGAGNLPSVNTKVINDPEVKAPNAIKSSNVTGAGDNYLGKNTTI